MKKSILILCACAAFAGCSEDDLVVKKPAIPGSEVQFGATAYMSDGNSTRTEYGDADAVNKKIELRWVAGDKIDIACEQAAAGRRKAAYQIVTESIVKDPNSSTIDNGKATMLEKVGEYGIQWGEPGPHTFYALYPSSESFTSDERGKIGMDGTGVNGYLPVNQNPEVTKDKDDDNNYILKPDMRYAFMVADANVNSTEVNTVSLRFEPLVTALQFELTAPVITNNTNAPKDLTITAVSLYSFSGQDICGSFQYKFKTKTITETNEGTGFSRITQTISKEVKLSSVTKNKVDVTFFVLPSADMKKGDFRLQVFYNYNGSPYVKTLKIGMDLEAKKKYYFRNVKLPDINASVQGSTWFSALAPNVYISQLSIPVAGNAFSSYYKGDTSSPSTDPKFYKEQTLHYTELWNKGVRGFEFSTSLGCTRSGRGTIISPYEYTYQNTLENEYFVCNGEEMTTAKGTDGTAVTFGNAFRKLAGQLDIEEFKNECLIIICTYKTYDGDSDIGCNPQHYVNDLEAWLEANPDVNNKLVKLTPTSTVNDLRGHIAIIVRPGEDAYSSIATSSIKVTNTNLTLVQDWGTCVDKWNRRFGSTYAIEGAMAKTGETKIEDYLWATGSTTQGDYSHSSYGPDFAVGDPGYPTTNSFSFDHNTNTTNKDGQTVHVQEWARIIPSAQEFNNPFYSGLSASHIGGHDTYLWLKWPESYSQKLAMIKETVATSMDTKGGTTENKIYINSLCGYYPVKELPVSYYPYNSNYTYDCQGRHSYGSYSPSFSLSGAGAGGDYVSCAYGLNKWLYEYLTKYNTDGENGPLKQGPVGLVMLNHIGNTTDHADDKSLDLVNWIMMNNFKFPLATKPSDPVDPPKVQ